MNIMDYIGLRYDITGVHGVNCWTLVALIYKQELNIELSIYSGITNKTQDIADQFRYRLESGQHEFTATDKPNDYDLVIFVSSGANETYHCGIYYKGKVIHANGKGRRGSVWYDKIKSIKHDKIRFLRYAAA